MEDLDRRIAHVNITAIEDEAARGVAHAAEIDVGGRHTLEADLGVGLQRQRMAREVGGTGIDRIVANQPPADDDEVVGVGVEPRVGTAQERVGRAASACRTRVPETCGVPVSPCALALVRVVRGRMKRRGSRHCGDYEANHQCDGSVLDNLGKPHGNPLVRFDSHLPERDNTLYFPILMGQTPTATQPNIERNE